MSLTLAASWPGAAQEQRAGIEGVVRDAQATAVPGVAVVARSATGLAIETVTDVAGVYRFAALPPGRYEVSARLSGFRPAKVVNVDLRLGQQLQIDATLEAAGPDETVEVVSESPLVAITQSVHATSLRDEEIEKMPRGRDFTSLTTPGRRRRPGRTSPEPLAPNQVEFWEQAGSAGDREVKQFPASPEGKRQEAWHRIPLALALIGSPQACRLPRTCHRMPRNCAHWLGRRPIDLRPLPRRRLRRTYRLLPESRPRSRLARSVLQRRSSLVSRRLRGATHQCDRSARTGSTLAARRAGTTHAATATSAIRSGARIKLTASRAAMP
jgi:hypothetical protein